jgi:Ca-activated chloride channel family protein
MASPRPLGSSALAQERQSGSAQVAQEPLKARTELVRVDVNVTDARGSFVGDLRQRNFRILDDGAERPITFFASTETPVQVLVLVETGPAVYLIHRQHLEAAYALLDGLAANDRAALAAYSDTPRVLLPFTEDKGALASALVHLEYGVGMGQLNLFGALSAVLDWLAPLPGRKAMVLLSTGLNTSAPSAWNALAEKFRVSEVTVFPVALGGSLRSFEAKDSKKPNRKNSKAPAAAEPDAAFAEKYKPSFEEANRELEALARISGGRAYFPTSRDDFVSIYRQIASALRHQYTLGFEPARDGRLHKVEVQVVDGTGQPMTSAATQSGYHVFAREGYLAPAR